LSPASSPAQKTRKERKALKLSGFKKNPGGEAIHDHNKHGEICLGLVLDWGYADLRAANQLWAALDRLSFCGLQNADFGWTLLR